MSKTIIYDCDLLNGKYDEDTIIQNMNHLNKKIIIHTQTLSEEFCAKYMFCIDDIDDGDEDSYLFDYNYIMRKQPHLDEEKFNALLDKILETNDIGAVPS